MNRHWWVLPAICAFLLVVCGMGCLVWPAKFLNLLPQTLGACFALAGAIQIIFVFFHRHSPTLPHFVWLSGLVTAITGGVFLFNAHVSLLFLGIFCGIWAITWGVLRSVAAMKKKRLGLSWKTPLTGSIIYIAMGAALLFSPLWGPLQIAKTMGVLFILSGTGLLYGWYITRNFVKKLFLPPSQNKNQTTANCTNKTK